MCYRSAQEREQQKRIRIETGSLAKISSFFHELCGTDPVSTIKVNRREAVVARQDQLRLAYLFRQRERFMIDLLRLLELALTLMDLRHHDQRNRQVIQLFEFAVEVGGRLRRIETLRLTSIGEGTVRGCEICVDVGLKRDGADLEASSNPVSDTSIARCG